MASEWVDMPEYYRESCMDDIEWPVAALINWPEKAQVKLYGLWLEPSEIAHVF